MPKATCRHGSWVIGLSYTRTHTTVAGFMFTLFSLAGQDCTGPKPVVEPPRLVVKYGGPASATCSSSDTVKIIGCEATVGATSADSTQQLVWNVASVPDWSLRNGVKCYTNSDEHGQCMTNLPITIYSESVRCESVMNLSSHIIETQHGTMGVVLNT